jgi:acyl-CoA reductase-like NAD-dependent aldehyde dehydrogenase
MQEEIFGPILPILSYSNKSGYPNHIFKIWETTSTVCFTENDSFANEIIQNIPLEAAALMIR